MTLFLQRDSKVFLEKTVGSQTQYWEVPVLEGFSFSQGNETTETVLSEMADDNGLTRRGRRMFNDALSPAEWSFSTYIRPFKSSATGDGKADTTGAHHLIEEALWANFVGDGGWMTSTSGVATVDTPGGGASGAAGTYEIDQLEYTTDSASGSGATFRITHGGGTLDASAVTIVNPGSGYVVNDTFTIPKESIGDASSDFTFDVATLTSGAGAAYDYELENIVHGTSSSAIYFTGSNQAELGTFALYFVLGAQNAATANNYTSAEIADGKIKIYKIANCVVNEATINFDVDGIAMIDWSGNGTEITAYTSALNMTTASGSNGGVVTEDITATDNFIRNKLTALSATAANTSVFDGAGSGVYNFTLTGGSITFSNNITFLTPEELGTVNTPIGHITGNKSISGNFTCYISAGLAGDSADFYADMVSTSAKEIITNSFDLTFKLGGSSGTPRFEINLPTTHIEIPTVNIEDVIAVDMSFHGIPSSIEAADEATLTIVGAA